MSSQRTQKTKSYLNSFTRSHIIRLTCICDRHLLVMLSLTNTGDMLMMNAVVTICHVWSEMRLFDAIFLALAFTLTFGYAHSHTGQMLMMISCHFPDRKCLPILSAPTLWMSFVLTLMTHSECKCYLCKHKWMLALVSPGTQLIHFVLFCSSRSITITWG